MFRERTYRSNFVVVSLAVTVVLLVMLPFMPGGLGYLVRLPGYLPGVLEIIAGVWVFFYFVCRLCTMAVGPLGVRGYNGIGMYYDVPWSAMQSVSAIWPYILVRHGKWGSAVCIPLFLTDQKGFRDYVLQHAPEGNPLRKYLQNG